MSYDLIDQCSTIASFFLLCCLGISTTWVLILIIQHQCFKKRLQISSFVTSIASVFYYSILFVGYRQLCFLMSIVDITMWSVGFAIALMLPMLRFFFQTPQINGKPPYRTSKSSSRIPFTGGEMDDKFSDDGKLFENEPV